MKKKLLLGIFALLFVSKVFAVEYVYYEEHKTVGNNTVHAKVCFPKNFSDDATANKMLRELVLHGFGGESAKYRGTHSITGVHFTNGIYYRIIFIYASIFDWHIGTVWVGKGNPSFANADLEVIYDTGVVRWSYNTLYRDYQEQCNKYLSILE